MMNQYCALNTMKTGESAVVQSVNTSGAMRRRLMDIGLVKDTRVQCIGRSCTGDPAAYLIRGAVIAIRSEDGRNILVKE